MVNKFVKITIVKIPIFTFQIFQCYIMYMYKCTCTCTNVHVIKSGGEGKEEVNGTFDDD